MVVISRVNMVTIRKRPMRIGYALLIVAGLSACATQVPDTAGVGFGSYDEYAARREQELRSGVTTAPLDSPAQQAPGAPLSALDPAATTPAATGAIGTTAGQGGGAAAGSQIEKTPPITPPSNYQPENAAPIVAEPLPPRDGANEPNIVQYALSTTNQVGEQVYRRTNPFAKSTYDRNCARYSSSDLAQEAFLEAGGPERDSRNLDPDGDGFACEWSPEPYRNAVR